MAPTSQTTTFWAPCPMRHCCPVGDATEIRGVLGGGGGGMASELKQTGGASVAIGPGAGPREAAVNSG